MVVAVRPLRCGGSPVHSARSLAHAVGLIFPNVLQDVTGSHGEQEKWCSHPEHRPWPAKWSLTTKVPFLISWLVTFPDVGWVPQPLCGPGMKSYQRSQREGPGRTGVHRLLGPWVQNLLWDNTIVTSLVPLGCLSPQLFEWLMTFPDMDSTS